MSEKRNGGQDELQKEINRSIAYVGIGLVATLAARLLSVDAVNQVKGQHPTWTSSEIDANYYANIFEPGPHLQFTLAQSVSVFSLAVLALTAVSVIRKIASR